DRADHFRRAVAEPPHLVELAQPTRDRGGVVAHGSVPPRALLDFTEVATPLHLDAERVLRRDLLTALAERREALDDAHRLPIGKRADRDRMLVEHREIEQRRARVAQLKDRVGARPHATLRTSMTPSARRRT